MPTDGVAQELVSEGLNALRDQQYNVAIDKLGRAVQQKPSVRGFHGLGAAYLATRRLDLAADHFRRALALRPHAPSYYQLGRILRNDGAIEAAHSAFTSALMLEPKSRVGRMELAITLNRLNRLSEAVVVIEGLIADEPKYHAAHAERAALLRRQGLLDPAFVGFCQAIEMMLEQRDFQPTAPRNLVVKSGGVALVAAKKRLDAANLRFFLCAGTLLGVVRSGGLLPFDKDIDFGVLSSTPRQAVIDALCNDGEFMMSVVLPQTPEQLEWRVSVIHRQTRTAIDLYFFKPDGDAYLCGVHALPTPILSRPRGFALERLRWQEMVWWVPHVPTNYLEDLYGPSWRQEDPYFDTVVSSACQVPESRDVRCCSGYSRLYGALHEAKWAKSLSLLQQLARRRPDPFLEQVKSWILSHQGRANRDSQQAGPADV